MRSLPASLVAVALLAFACGGKDKPPPAAASAAKADGPSNSDLSKVDEAEWADAGLDLSLAKADSDGGAAPAPAAASPGPAPGAAAASDPSDDCTPAGVDLEQRARPKLKECYREGKKKDPNLQGAVRITLVIDYRGKVKSIKITEKTLPDPVAQCMLKVVKSTPFPEAQKCPDKNITIPMAFPTPP